MAKKTKKVLFSAVAVEVVDDDEEPVLGRDFKAEKSGSRTRSDTVRQEEEQISDTGFSIAEKKLLTENKFEFQAEINRLMGILINSLYSNRDIFLREVISNASDALDKIRFLSLTDKSVLGEGEGSKLEIRIKVDRKNRILHVRDTGLGMTKQDLVNNLGRIAKSGTADFIEKLSKSDSMTSQIGQFGVGFYSTFLAANTVTVTTKHNDDVQYVWESSDTDQGSYTIAEDPRGNTLGRGTLISMHLRADAEEYLDEAKLREMIRKYSEFINFPIYLWAPSEKDTYDDLTEEEEEVTEEELKAASVAGDLVDEEEAQELFKTEVWDWELLNQNKPIWTRKPSDISDEEYKKFYQAIVKDESEPIHRIHFTAEGDHSFTGLLYIPGTPPFSMFDQRAALSNLKLYVKRVFITDRFDLLPKFLSFLAGVVDSDDLPLNISRESLQQHRIMDIIRKKLVRKALAMFQDLANDLPEAYAKFYAQYHTNLKLGAIEDFTNRARIMKLLRFNTYNHPEKQISLDEYAEQMRPGQDKIYFLGGESNEVIRTSPLLETLTSKGYDVIFLTAPIDEYLVEVATKYEHGSTKLKFADVGKEGLKVDADEEKKVKHMRETFKPLTEFLKKHLIGKFYAVKLTNRLRNTPCALVAAANSYSANMERIIKAQALGGDERMKHVAPVNKVLELNPHHPIIEELLRLVNEGQEDRAKEAGQLLFDGAVVSSGFALEEPLSFSHRLYRALSQNLNIDTSEFDARTAKPLVFDPSADPEPEATEDEDSDFKDEL
jgi:heat shock protein beta